MTNCRHSPLPLYLPRVPSDPWAFQLQIRSIICHTITFSSLIFQIHYHMLLWVINIERKGSLMSSLIRSVYQDLVQQLTKDNQN